jgi:HdeA/HdeB family
MWKRAVAQALAMALGFAGPVTGAMAQQLGLPCDSFVKNDDGSWSALRSVPIHGVGESFTVREGSVLRPGAAIRGVDLAGMLDERCPATPEPPPGAAAALTPATPARVTLGSFANASGVVDAQRLSCAEIADASPEEARLFLAWYSGWYAGAAKRRGVNLTGTQEAIQAVMQHCAANRDKKIVQVMDLMLK